MRILVTGATGFVGGGVVRALLADGHEVHGLVRDPGAASALRRDGIILHVGDMRQPATYAPIVGQVDAVVQAAQLSTSGRVTRARAAQVFAAEHTMTTALAQACLEHGRRLLYTGGCFDWGDHGDEWITEDTPLSPSPMGEGGPVPAAHARRAGTGRRAAEPGFRLRTRRAAPLGVRRAGQEGPAPLHRQRLDAKRSRGHFLLRTYSTAMDR